VAQLLDSYMMMIIINSNVRGSKLDFQALFPYFPEETEVIFNFFYDKVGCVEG
jgi:hypothetical protein